jgi:hypothetical protein
VNKVKKGKGCENRQQLCDLEGLEVSRLVDGKGREELTSTVLPLVTVPPQHHGTPERAHVGTKRG